MKFLGISLNYFTENSFWNITYLNWVFFGIFILIAILLKKVITIIINKVVFRIVSRYFGEASALLVSDHLTKPLGGLIKVVFFYFAWNQLYAKLDRIFLIKNAREIAKEVKIDKLKEMNRLSIFDIGERIFELLIVYFVFYLVIRIVTLVLKLRLLRAERLDDRAAQQVIPLMKDVSKVILWTIALATILSVVFNINFTALFAGLGIGGVAIAFAAKESLENLIASFMVLVDKPFTIGDWIKIGDTEGIIEKVGFRSSRLRTFDKSIVIIPNRKLIDSNLENFSNRGIRRYKFTIGGIYGISQENYEKAIKEMEEAIPKVSGVQEEGTKVWFDKFGDSQLNLEVMYFILVDPEINFFEVKHNVNFIIYNIMYKYCQGFAFPTQMAIHGDEVNEVIPRVDEKDRRNNDDEKNNDKS